MLKKCVLQDILLAEKVWNMTPDNFFNFVNIYCPEILNMSAPTLLLAALSLFVLSSK